MGKKDGGHLNWFTGHSGNERLKRLQKGGNGGNYDGAWDPNQEGGKKKKKGKKVSRYGSKHLLSAKNLLNMAGVTKDQLHDNMSGFKLHGRVGEAKRSRKAAFLRAGLFNALLAHQNNWQKIPAIDVGLANLSPKGVKTRRVTGKIRRYLNRIHRGEPVLAQKGGIAPLLFLAPLAAKAAALAPLAGKAILGGALSSGTGFGIQKLLQQL